MTYTPVHQPTHGLQDRRHGGVLGASEHVSWYHVSWYVAKIHKNMQKPTLTRLRQREHLNTSQYLHILTAPVRTTVPLTRTCHARLMV